MKTCMICFDETEKVVSCPDKQCECNMCYDCCKGYINSCKGDGVLPVCPLPSCSWRLVLTDIKVLGNSAVKKYLKLCFVFLDNEEAKEEERKEAVVTAIRRKRAKYIEEHFPPSVSLVIEICMKKKLAALDASIRKQTEEKSTVGKKKCFSILCDGYLDNYMICCDCDRQWCLKCEKEKERDHVCDPNDLESMKLLNTYVKCPNCYVPVEKSLGCNNMTCGMCKTNFSYTTGEKTQYGSEKVRPVHLKGDNVSKISEDRETEELVTMIEKRVAVKPLKDDILPKMIAKGRKLLETKEKYSFLIKLAKKFEKIEKNKIAIKRHRSVMREIEKYVYKRQKDKLREVLDRL